MPIAPSLTLLPSNNGPNSSIPDLIGPDLGTDSEDGQEHDLLEGFATATDFRQGQEQTPGQFQQGENAPDHDEHTQDDRDNNQQENCEYGHNQSVPSGFPAMRRFHPEPTDMERALNRQSWSRPMPEHDYPIQESQYQLSSNQQSLIQQTHDLHGVAQQRPAQHVQGAPHHVPRNEYPFPIQQPPVQLTSAQHRSFQPPPIQYHPLQQIQTQIPQIPHAPLPSAWTYQSQGEQIPTPDILAHPSQEHYKSNHPQAPLSWRNPPHHNFRLPKLETSDQQNEHDPARHLREQQSANQQLEPQQMTPAKTPDQLYGRNATIRCSLTITFEGSGLGVKTPWSLVIHQEGHTRGTRYRIKAYNQDGVEVDVETIPSATTFSFIGDYDDELVGTFITSVIPLPERGAEPGAGFKGGRGR